MNENHRSPQPAPGPYCASYDSLLALQSVGELEPERAAALRDHLAGCAWCRERLREYTTVHAALLGTFGRDVGPPPALTLDDIVRAAEDEEEGEDADGLDIDGMVGRPRPAQAARPMVLPPHPTGRRRLAGAVAAALLLTLVGAALFRTHREVPSGDILVPGLGTLAEFPLPAPGRQPRDIIAGPDGAVWFREDGHLGRITPAGRITQFPLPGGATASGLTAGPDGNLWFTDVAGARIGRLNPHDGAVTEFALPAGTVLSGSIVARPDGDLWFRLERGQSSGGPGNGAGKTPAIGRITPRGVITESPLPSPDVSSDLTAGPDGNLWFTGTISDTGQDAIGRVSPSGVVTWFPVLGFKSQASGLTVGPDGNFWLTFWDGVQMAVGRFTPQGVFTEFDHPRWANSAAPGDLIVGPDGNLWASGLAGSVHLVRITPAGRTTVFELPAGMALNGITGGPDGALWGTDIAANRIVRIELAPSG